MIIISQYWSKLLSVLLSWRCITSHELRCLLCNAILYVYVALVTVTGGDKNTATSNKSKIMTHLESFKLKRPDFTLTDGGFVDADISVGIAGARMWVFVP